MVVTRSSAAAAAAATAALIGSNDDILTEILLRLPAASILRFKSVCKQWRLLLSHSHFTHRFDNLLKSPGCLIHYNYNNKKKKNKTLYIPFDDNHNHNHNHNNNSPPFRNLGFYFDRSNVEIEQSCNGLLLCSSAAAAADDDDYEKCYYVFNPTTKQLSPIPSVPPGAIYSMVLAFHPTHCAYYKLICVTIYESSFDRNLCQLHVYSSDTRTWRTCVESFCVESCGFTYPCYWNGAVLWTSDIMGRVLILFRLEVYDVVIDEDEGTFLVLLASDKLLRYNVHDGSIKELYHMVFLETPHRYIETLSSF